MKIIGITGTSGSGKTTVSQIFTNKYNAKTIDADKVARKLSKKGNEYFLEIVKKFGTEILQKDGQLDRRKLSQTIYLNEEKRNLLNEITYKYVVEQIKKEIAQINKIDLIIIDAPLLIESGLKTICNIVISVIADEKIKIERICKRDNIDINMAKLRLSIQPKNEFYIKNSDYILNNNDNNNLEKEIMEIMSKVL